MKGTLHEFGILEQIVGEQEAVPAGKPSVTPPAVSHGPEQAQEQAERFRWCR